MVGPRKKKVGTIKNEDRQRLGIPMRGRPITNEILLYGMEQDKADGSTLDQVNKQKSFEAVQLYFVSGSLTKVARELGISSYEMMKLSKTKWWSEELHLIKVANNAALDAQLTSILGSSLDQLQDRVELGNIHISSSGNKMRVKLDAIELSKIASMVFDKRQLVRELPTRINEDAMRLSSLARKLEQLGAAQKALTIDEEPKPIPTVD